MMLTARTVEAAEAREVGLVDMLSEADGLDAMVDRLVEQVLANSWHTNRHTKRIVRQTEGMALGEALAWEAYNYPGYAPDYDERVARFTKKSPHCAGT